MQINYDKSAIDILTPMLSVAQQAKSNDAQRRKEVFEGVKGLVEGGSKAYGVYKRKGLIQYIGDDKLNEMKQQLAELEAELQSVENQMRTIKAEDIGSLDINQDLGTPAETDVNAWNVNGGRMTEYPVNTPYGTQDSSMMKPGFKALGGI